MAGIAHEWLVRRHLRRERVFWDRENPVETFNDTELVARYRFTRESILYLVEITRGELQYDSLRNMPLPPILQLTVALRFFATGSFLLVVGDTLPRVSKATVCRCVHRVALILSRQANRLCGSPIRKKMLIV